MRCKSKRLAFGRIGLRQFPFGWTVLCWCNKLKYTKKDFCGTLNSIARLSELFLPEWTTLKQSPSKKQANSGSFVTFIGPKTVWKFWHVSIFAASGHKTLEVGCWILRFCLKNIRSYSACLRGQDATLYHLEKHGWAEGPTLRWQLSRPHGTPSRGLGPGVPGRKWRQLRLVPWFMAPFPLVQSEVPIEDLKKYWVIGHLGKWFHNLSPPPPTSCLSMVKPPKISKIKLEWFSPVWTCIQNQIYMYLVCIRMSLQMSYPSPVRNPGDEMLQVKRWSANCWPSRSNWQMSLGSFCCSFGLTSPDGSIWFIEGFNSKNLTWVQGDV